MHNKNLGESLVCGHHLSRVPFKRISIYVEESLIEYASALGGGNISLGFRRLAENNHKQDAIRLAQIESEIVRLLEILKGDRALGCGNDSKQDETVVAEDIRDHEYLKHRLPELETLYKAAMNIFEENNGCLPAGEFHDKLLDTGVDPFVFKEFYETYEGEDRLWRRDRIKSLYHVVLNK